ncbi:MAG: DUF4013 domain-containing protein [Cyanobacteriota bacterium]
MKLNLERSFTAPFTSMGESSLSTIYLIAGGITLLAFVLIMLFQFGFQVILGILQVAAGDGTGAIVVGVLSIIVSLLLVVVNMACMALPYGYITETAKLEIYDRTSIMPSWEGNFARFFWNGLKVQLIMLVYGILIVLLCLIPILITVAIAILVNGQSSDIMGIVGGIGGIICFIIIATVILFYMFMLPMIIVFFAAEGRMSAGFNVIGIWGKILTNIVEYLLAIVIVILLSIVAGIAGTVIVCTCIGILVIPLLWYFIFPIISLNMFAQLYKD